MLSCQTLIQGFVLCLRRGAARHIWFVFQPQKIEDIMKTFVFFWRGGGNWQPITKLTKNHGCRRKAEDIRTFVFFSHHVHESWGWPNSVGISSLLTLWSVSQRTGAANREQHLCSQGDRQVPGNIRVVLASPPHFPDGGRDVSCQTCCCLALYDPTNNENWYVNSQAKTLP